MAAVFFAGAVFFAATFFVAVFFAATFLPAAFFAVDFVSAAFFVAKVVPLDVICLLRLLFLLAVPFETAPSRRVRMDFAEEPEIFFATVFLAAVFFAGTDLVAVFPAVFFAGGGAGAAFPGAFLPVALLGGTEDALRLVASSVD